MNSAIAPPLPGQANTITYSGWVKIVYSSHLIDQIKTVDPDFVDRELLPEDGIAGLSWEGRNNLINNLRMERAAVFYKVRGDLGPLQVESLRYLQQAVDVAYAEGINQFELGLLTPRLSREEAVGNYVDATVRREYRELLNSYNISYGRGSNITINNRDYDTSGGDSRYTVPDARIGNASFDWTLTRKTISSPQVRGFFSADSSPDAVIIVRPRALGQSSTYLIPRPSTLAPRR